MNLTELPSEMIGHIHSFGRNKLGQTNVVMNETYKMNGYIIFGDLLRKIFPEMIVPEYDEDINWNAEYDNLSNYVEYMKIMETKYKNIPLAKI